MVISASEKIRGNINHYKIKPMQYIIKHITIEGLVSRRVCVETQDIEAFRTRYANMYNVKPGMVKLVYEERE